MALPCGTRAEAEPQQSPLPVETVANRFWRSMGFVTMVAASLCVVAAVILLPPYAKLQRVRHQRDLQAHKLQEARNTVATMDRLIAQAPSDDVLNRRLAWSRLGLYPSRDVVILDPGLAPAAAPGTVTTAELPAPPPPDPGIQAAAERVSSSSRRHGLLVLAASLLIGAVLLFGPPSMRLKRRTIAPPAITAEARKHARQQKKHSPDSE